jgi:acetyl esterase/lipase
MKRFLVAAVALVALAALATLPASAAPPTSAPPAPHDVAKPALLPVEVKRDVLYDTIGGQKLYLDIAMPKEGGPYPCVAAFHGGAWMLGSRKELSSGTRAAPSIIERVAARGYVVASVGYRLAPKHPFPAQIEDARAAVRFLRARAKDYRIDRDKFASAGFSAGGHLALLLGLAGDVKDWKAGGNLDESAKVQCVVDFFGPTDLCLYSGSPGIVDSYLVPVFGKACKADPDVLKKASPITYVSKGDPPVLMIHGNFDLIVPVVHSEKLLKKLKGDGVTAELVTVSGEGHGWNGPTLARTLDDGVKFLDEHLKGKGGK